MPVGVQSDQLGSTINKIAALAETAGLQVSTMTLQVEDILTQALIGEAGTVALRRWRELSARLVSYQEGFASVQQLLEDARSMVVEADESALSEMK